MYGLMWDKKPISRQKDTIQRKLKVVTFDLYNELHELSGVIY
jgi:hypothetical protein